MYEEESLIENVIYRADGDAHDTGLVLFKPKVFGDRRGYFMETYNMDKWKIPGEPDYDSMFIQDNESCSAKGVMRGLHYQYFDENHVDFCQAKLVRVVRGAIVDFVLDVRRSSPSFGQLFWFRLDSVDKRQLFVPHGFAHGFVALEDDTVFAYKCDMYYNKASERGISMFDPKLGIEEKILKPNGLTMADVVVSDKDRTYSNFRDQRDLF